MEGRPPEESLTPADVAAAVAFTTGEIIEIKRRRCGSRDDPLGRVMEGTDSSIVPQY